MTGFITTIGAMMGPVFGGCGVFGEGVLGTSIGVLGVGVAGGSGMYFSAKSEMMSLLSDTLAFKVKDTS